MLKQCLSIQNQSQNHTENQKVFLQARERAKNQKVGLREELIPKP